MVRSRSKCALRRILLAAAAMAAAAVPRPTGAVPVQHTISQRAAECLYDRLDANERVTVSVFLTAGADLKATATFEGPIAPADASSGAEVNDALKKYQLGTRFGTGPDGKEGNLRREMIVDFENDDWDDDDDRAMFDDDVDDDDHYYDDDDDSRSMEEKTKSAKQRQEDRKKRIEAKRKRMEAFRAEKIKKHARAAEGEARQQTYQVEVAGWYRACVKASFYEVTAEIEMRRESELGGMDKKTGHVISHQRRATMLDEKGMKEKSAGLKDEDLKGAHEKLRKLNRLLNEIKEEQQAERRRLDLHATLNSHSHSRMVMNSLFETIVFMAITGFQIYTIRNWFSGSPMLGITREERGHQYYR